MEKDRKTILKIYVLLAVSVVAGFVPNLWSGMLALLLFSATPTIAGWLRKRAGVDGLVVNHMTFVIRTVYITVGLAAVTMAVAAWYLVAHDDLSPLQPCANRLMATATPSALAASRLITPCIGNFLFANRRLLIVSGAIASLPLLLYLGFRLALGIGQARRSLPVANVKRWL